MGDGSLWLPLEGVVILLEIGDSGSLKMSWSFIPTERLGLAVPFARPGAVVRKMGEGLRRAISFARGDSVEGDGHLGAACECESVFGDGLLATCFDIGDSVVEVMSKGSAMMVTRLLEAGDCVNVSGVPACTVLASDGVAGTELRANERFVILTEGGIDVSLSR